MKPKHLLFGVLLCFALPLHAQKLAFQTTMRQSKPFLFMENKGQLEAPTLNGEKQPLPEIKFYGAQNGVNIYCKPNTISFVFTKVETKNDSNLDKESRGLSPAGGGRGWKNPIGIPQPSTITTSRIDLNLIGSNPKTQITATDQQEYYENFYTSGNAENGITDVHGYKTITYQNIYPYIDMVLKINPKQGMEYSFIIHPGGNVKDIQMQWNGVDSLNMFNHNAGIRYANSLGLIKETGMKTYLVKSKESIDCKYVIGIKNTIGFEVGGYDNSKVLIIDPTLQWATYVGGSSWDDCTGIATDSGANVIITGNTYSPSGIGTSGTFQTTFSGNSNAANAFISKFNPNGKILWGTYYAGNNTTASLVITCDLSSNIYISGATLSTSGIATSGAYQTAFGGGTHDAMLVKFSPIGHRQWSTYFGGGGDEASFGLSTDTAGNIYMCGYTTSTYSIASSGAYQTKQSGGVTYGDAFLAKFSSSGSVLWSTYFGGSNGDEALGVAVLKDGSPCIYGTTSSSSGIATSGAYLTSLSGGMSGFLAQFTPAGKINWGTYFAGINAWYAQPVAIDTSDNIFISGGTGTISGLATPGAYQTTSGGLSDGVLAKFSKFGQIIWCTYFGGSSFEDGSFVATDIYGNAYLTGWTQSQLNVATAGSYLSAYPASAPYAAYLAKFSADGGLDWSTYFGTSGLAQPWAIATDKMNNIIIGGITSINKGVATPGAYQTKYGDSTDAFVAKFKNYPIDASVKSIKNPITTTCAGTYPVKVLIKNYGSDDLKSVKIGWSVNKIIQSTYYWTGDIVPDSTELVNLGNYKFTTGIDTIKAWTFDPNGGVDSMPQNDTATGRDTILAFPKAVAGTNHPICIGAIFSLGSDSKNGYKYKWTSNPSGFTSTLSDPLVSPTINTEYYLSVSSPGLGCISTDSITVSVIPLPNPNVGGDRSICLGDTLILGSAPVKNHIYGWSSLPAGFTSTVSQITVKPTTTIQYFLTEVDTTTWCNVSNSATITVNTRPKTYAGGNQIICFGKSINIGENLTNGHSYSWTSNPAGFSSSSNFIIINPNVPTTYYLKETINSTGCSSLDSAKIVFNALPKVLIAENQSICQGSSINLGGNPINDITYSWTSNPIGFTSSLSNPTLTADSTKTYYLTVTDITTGCTNTDSASITVNPLPGAISKGTKLVCEGSAINLGTSPINGITYSWSSNPLGFNSTISNPVVTPIRTTHYILTETILATGCSKTDSAFIIVNPFPKADAGKNQFICLGSGLALGANPINGHTYSWSSNPTGFSSGLSNPTVRPIIATEYYLTEIISATGCSKSDSVSIKINPLPKPVAGIAHVTCASEKITLGYSGTQGDTYQWTSNPTGFSSSLSMPLDSPIISTRYKLTETNPVTGCSNSDSTLSFVNLLPKPVIQGPNIICGNDSLQVYHVDYDSGATYVWAISNGQIITGQGGNNVFIKFNFGVDTIAVTETNANGCPGANSKQVIVRQNPNAHFSVAKDSPSYIYTALDSNENYYDWALGDGTTGNLYKLMHQYTVKKDTLVPVSLTVGSITGCSSIFDTFIKIHYFLPPFFNIKLFPNPFQNLTNIQIELENGAHVQIIVYDAIGRLITTLADARQSIGKHTYTLDGDKYDLSSGVYFLKILIDDKIYVREVVRQ